MKQEAEFITREQLIAGLKEMREACAACFRVIIRYPGAAQQLDEELAKAGVPPGFGVAVQTLIAAAEKNS